MDFFTSDTHFGHENIITYCNRPYDSVDAMNRDMICRWNDVVTPSDTVYHLGDFALGPKSMWPHYREQLNGRIIFILGNHDQPIARFKNDAMVDGDECHRAMEYHSDHYGLVSLGHAPPGWHETRDTGQVVERHSGKATRVADLYLCGHIHNKWVEQPDAEVRCINVGVDVWEFQPQPLYILAGRAGWLSNG